MQATNLIPVAMLALAYLRWLRVERPEVAVDLVAFRGGELVEAMRGVASVTVLLHDHEAWDHDRPDPRRVAEIARLTGGAACRFDASAPAELRALLRAVAAYAAGGQKALTDYARREGGAVRLLEQQTRRRS